MEKQKVILVIRDGWGQRKDSKDNLIMEANPIATNELMKEYPNTLLKCSGEDVGLPKGFQGNSEVGHMTIGSGRIIFQSMAKIDKAIKTKEFFKNKEFLAAINNCKKNKTALHLIGLAQEEGVHSHLNHLMALLDLCKQEKFANVKIHIITDGRDAPVTKSIEYVKKIEDKISKIGFGEITTISGRFYAMDRDNRMERTKKAYDCIVDGKCEDGKEFENALTTIKKSHNENITDEFIVPRKKIGYDGVKENDSIIFFNFRTDRTRQLTKAIVEKKFDGWVRERGALKVFFVAMTQFYTPMNAHVAFEDTPLTNLLGEVISKSGLKQLRISETEKYAHVTFFFNGQIETPFKNEDRSLTPSPKVETYDLMPEMSAFEVTEKLTKAIESAKYDFIVVNLVNCDMVGHTGKKEAILKAVKTVDECTKNIVNSALDKNYTLLIFADHGNAEDYSIEWRTSHTLNKVPLIIVSKNQKIKNSKLKSEMGLADIAPTVLDLLNIKKPKEMSGESIFE